MPSRDPDELVQTLRSAEFSGDTESLVELRSEARKTVESQVETLDDIDTKASRILRLNILLIGVLVSIFSILARNATTDPVTNDTGSLVNAYVFLGVSSIVLSTAFATMTYTASELDVGISSDNLINLLEADFARTDIEELLLKNYIVRINFNRSTNIRNIPLIQTTIVLVVAGVVFFALGVYESAIGAVPRWLLGSSMVVLIVVVIGSGLPTQFVRAVRDLREWK